MKDDTQVREPLSDILDEDPDPIEDTYLHRVAVDDRTCEILVVRSENPMCVAVMRDDGNGRLDGCLLLDIDQRPLEDMARLIAGTEEFDELEDIGIGLVRDSFPHALAIHALRGDDCPGYEEEQVAAMGAFIRARAPEPAIAWMSAARLAEGETFRWLQLFADGDREARAQAVWELPVHAASLIRMPGLVEAIDARREVLPELSRSAQDEIRKLCPDSKPTGDMTSSFRDVRSALWGSAGLKDVDLDKLAASVGRKLLKVEQLARQEAREPEALSQVADSLAEMNRAPLIRALTVVRDDQLPPDWSGVVNMRAAVSAAENAAGRMKLSMAPFLRRFARVKPDGWAEALASLPGPREAQLVADYIETTSSRIAGSVMVGLIREHLSAEAFDRVRGIAERIWAREDVTPGDAQIVTPFLELCSYGYRHPNVLRPLDTIKGIVAARIGQNTSLKQIGELQERWHHNHMLLESRAMSDSGELTWQALTGDVTLQGDTVARELNSSKLLGDQGRRERHCVGGHAPRILTSTEKEVRAVYSLETAEGEILSTVEVRGTVIAGSHRAPPSATWSIAEHQAERNTPPCLRARKAAQELLTHLQDMHVDRSIQYTDMLKANPGNLVPSLQGAVAKFRMNPTNREIPEIVLGASDMILPRGLRGRTVEEWSDDICADEAGSMAFITAGQAIEKVVEAIEAAIEADRTNDRAADAAPSPI